MHRARLTTRSLFGDPETGVSVWLRTFPPCGAIIAVHGWKSTISMPDQRNGWLPPFPVFQKVSRNVYSFSAEYRTWIDRMTAEAEAA